MRKAFWARVSVFIIVICPIFNACDALDNVEEEPFSARVSFVDVGVNECTVICLPDGKTVLIDVGDEGSFDKVRDKLNENGVQKIDYLFLTHPDSEHVGGVAGLLQYFNVVKVFHPNVCDGHAELFPTYKNAISLLANSGAELDVSDNYDYIAGENYFIAILSPSLRGGFYLEFNSSLAPTARQVDNLSCVIYAEIFGIRFIFTADSKYEVEQKIIADNDYNFYNNAYFGHKVNMSSVDFLKVSSGGSDGASGEDFLSLLKPKNAVIATGGIRAPSNLVLNRLYNSNHVCKILRTDVYGNVDVDLMENQTYKTIKESDK